MARSLGDVLHYFIPEAGTPADGGTPPPGGLLPRPNPTAPAALPIVSVAIGDSDVVRAAFTWNLGVEVARLGGRAVVVTPACDQQSPLWPEEGVGPMGAELVVSQAGDLGGLHRAALDVAVDRAALLSPGASGVVFVRVPPAWLCVAADAPALLRWTLLYTSSDRRELLETYGLAKLLLGVDPSSRVGVTLHGVRRKGEAEAAFTRLARSTEKHLGLPLSSYGMLVDDLHVYRAIVARRPIGLEHPQSPAARALRDVARLILEDAAERIRE